MLDERLIRADATKLDELHEIMQQQEHPELLCDIGMQAIHIEHKAVEKICDAVKALTPGKKVLMVSGPVAIVDTEGRKIKERIKALLEQEYEVEWFVVTEPDGIVHCTPENAARIQEHFAGVDCVVGIGGGTICDLCKYATYTANHDAPLPLVIVQTALSGYGDLIATWTAPVDWYLGNVLGMGKNFHTAPSDMICTQCEELLENSEKLAAGDAKVIGDLANVLTLSGLSMGLADESSPASGSEHVMSHLIDMASKVRHTGICYHGTQVAVSGINSCIIWDWLLNEFDPKAVDLDKCYPTAEEMEPRVRAAFDWLDDTHAAANECWSDYQKKLAKWHANKEKFADFLAHFDEFKATVAPWVKKPEYIADCMHKAKAPCRYSVLNFPVDAKTATWAMNNCHLMRNRFSVIDLLFYTGIWNEDFVQKIIARADSMDAGL